MLLIADGGSTKTDWVLLSPRTKREYRTSGINPYFMSRSEIGMLLTKTFDSKQRKQVKHIFFYGAGCAAEQRKQVVYNALVETFPEAEINIDTDLTGTARALFGNKPGIACILGTGSNCGFYDGKEITFKYPSLGYVLGDEGSGVAMGKHLLRDFLYNEMPTDLAKPFNQFMDIGRDKIMEQIYNNPFPNRFIASVIPFIKKHENHNYVINMIDSNLAEFFKYHIIRYPDVKLKDIAFTGSIASLFSERLNQVARGYGLKIHSIINFPLEILSNFHKEQVLL